MLPQGQGHHDPAVPLLPAEPPFGPRATEHLLERLPFETGKGHDGDRHPRLVAQVAVALLHRPAILSRDDARQVVDRPIVVRGEVDTRFGAQGRGQQNGRRGQDASRSFHEGRAHSSPDVPSDSFLERRIRIGRPGPCRARTARSIQQLLCVQPCPVVLHFHPGILALQSGGLRRTLQMVFEQFVA